MRQVQKCILAATMLAVAGTAAAQETAPIFEQVPAVMYETYKGVNNPAFNDYFEMLVGRYSGSDGAGWAIYREGPTVAYRITVLPEGLQSLLEIQQARRESFGDFTDAQTALWNAGWGTRHVAVYSAAPAMSVVPEGFALEDIRDLPYHRVMIYHLKWDKASEFRAALRRRAELDREAGIEDFVYTVWNGGIGTEAQTVMVRVAAASQAEDIGPNREKRNVARQAYREEFGQVSRAMSEAAWLVERHDQGRVSRLSYTPGS